MIPSGARGDAAGWSPASVENQARRRPSQRMSISDLSPSSRMTPQSLENRGLGIPWQKPVTGICSTLDVQQDEIEQARNFCLLPSPELHKRPAGLSLRADDAGPAEMQQRFLEGLHRASAAMTPEQKDADEESLVDCHTRRSPVFTPSSTRSPSPRPMSSGTASSSLTGPPPSWPPGMRRQARDSLCSINLSKRRSSLCVLPASWGSFDESMSP